MTHVTDVKGGSWLLEAADASSVLTPERLSDEHRLIAQTAQFEMKYAVGQLQAARYMASGTDW